MRANDRHKIFVEFIDLISWISINEIFIKQKKFHV